ncbi:Glycosyltransferase involved in cell wall bisynthesis [Flavobacterium segetis]|uniref:Glycosyltransferase involved in cell wall bisynthesis n=1 Tax=Flavobacterium segetis TaxID=271157 RepID=A0A1M5GTB7_9FLAO|nr:glycosyltransferase family 2 protein [Flavobacterium segetis]SHG07016.1 Glycosyltransferase involved in cell wall bisynthesis [Flavobacterium segetis]
MLAIIIPYYKLTFFEDTLKSLANQTDQRFNVYIGDDASIENPSNLLEKYIRKFNIVYKRFDSNLGGTSLTKQWERCIDLSRNEEWIMILGDDDVLGENVVESFYENLSEIIKEESNLVRFASQLIDGIGEIFSNVFLHPKLETAKSSYWRKLKRKTRSSLSEYIFKRNIYLQFKFRQYPLAWNSDDMAWLMFSDFKDIYTINSTVVLVRQTHLSISGKKDNLKEKNTSQLMFLKDLMNSRIIKLTKKERIELLYETEVSLKRKQKLTLVEWLQLAYEYIYIFSAIAILKFIRRFLIQLVR